MALASGSRLGPYEILSPLGAGGMGEVWRARDTRLAREVAIKVLPPDLSSDSDRLKRFEREARAASSLNHPTIVTIYDIGTTDSVSYIAMELVDGKTLRETLASGPLSVRKLLGIATQIADGLARAHSSGIVHRDLKPENVMVTKDGLVKILDFGLAKLSHPELADGEPTSMPTVSAATTPGIVMGTVAYMSPEQAAGSPVDFRSDQFSFGSMLYEMATGKQPFKRGTAAQTLAAIIQDDPASISVTNTKMPAPLRWIVDQCLAKEAKDRYSSTEDLARDLVRVRDHLGEVTGSGETAAIPPRRKRRLLWLFPMAFAVVLSAILAAAFLRRASHPSQPIRASLILPEKMILGNLALSPDGRRLAFTADTGGVLWIRALDGSTAQPITVGGDASLPFWSPDGRFVAFFSDGKLKRADVGGKTIQTICDAPEQGGGGSWGRDGTIVFAPSSTSALYRVSASGGQPVAVTKLNVSPHETGHRYPFFLPDGRHFLYMAQDLSSARDRPPNAIRVASLDGKLDKSVLQIASNAAYTSGHLFYVREETLFAQPFDLGRFETAGDPIAIAPHVLMHFRFHFQFGATERLLVFAANLRTPSRLLWIDRSGQPLGSVGDRGFFGYSRLSPDGRKVAVDVYDPARDVADIWIYDTATGAGTKLVVGSSSFDETPVWSPEGDRIIFFSYRKGKGGRTALLVKRIDSANQEVVLESPDESGPEDWSPDGRFVSISAIPTQGKRNTQVWVLSMDGQRKATPFATEAPTQENSRFSPDGRWIAFASDESGVSEVYVRSFPGPGGKWQISTAGGNSPRWRRDGKELFYLSADNKIVVVPVRLDPTFRAGAPATLFSVRPGSGYDVSADGQRFLVNSELSDFSSPPLTLIADWTALLKE